MTMAFDDGYDYDYGYDYGYDVGNADYFIGTLIIANLN